MDAVGAIVNIGFFIIIIFLISRVAHFFNNIKNKLDEMDNKIEELKFIISKQK